MLGIKIVLPNGGESVFEANRVELASDEFSQSSDDKVLFLYRNDGIVKIESGDVYVMNSNGKTIADYHFGYGTDDARQKVNATNVKL